MATTFTSQAAVVTDEEGRVRLLSYNRVYKPINTAGQQAQEGKENMMSVASFTTGPEAQPPSLARSIAGAYLTQILPGSNLVVEPDGAGFSFAFRPPGEEDEDIVHVRFKEEKIMNNTASIAYEQVLDDRRVWGGGVFVRINLAEQGVTGFQNAVHYLKGVYHKSDKTDNWMEQGNPTTQMLTGMLGLKDESCMLTITEREPWIFQYLEEERLKADDLNFITVIPSEDDEHPDITREQIFFAPEPVAERIRSGMYYEAIEVLFTTTQADGAFVHWRAFVEPDSSSLLYLRSFRSHWSSTAVFINGPASITRAAPSNRNLNHVSNLNPERIIMPLRGLLGAGGGKQELKSDFVQLKNYNGTRQVFPAASLPDDFIYDYDSYDFAACSAYYHCDSVFRLVQEMGFDVYKYFKDTTFPVPVDPLINGQNSCTLGNNRKGVEFFMFGAINRGKNKAIGLAADLRVVLHEFGHAILANHIQRCSFSFAHSMGDSLAAILCDPLNDALDRFETFPFTCQVSKMGRRHDRAVTEGWNWFGSKWDVDYGGEEVLSTTLFRVYRAAGGDSAHFAEKKFASRYLFCLVLRAVESLQFQNSNNVLDDLNNWISVLKEADLDTSNYFEDHPGGTWGKLFPWSFGRQGLNHPRKYSVKKDFERAAIPADFVDVYIDDGRKGRYMPYLENIMASPGIWNRNNPDGLEGNQRPVTGKENYIYVQIGNKGNQVAANLNISYYQSKVDQPVYWPDDWNCLEFAAPLSGQIAPGQKWVAGPFKWIPQSGEDVFLFAVSVPEDQSNIEDDDVHTPRTFKVLTRRLVILDNNIAMRRFSQ